MAFINKFTIQILTFNKLQHMYSPYTFLNPCIGYITDGKVKFAFPDKSEQFAEKGDLIYIPKGTTYQSTWTGEPLIRFYSLNFEFNNQSSYLYKFKILKNYPEENFKNMMEYFGSETTHLLSVGFLYSALYDIFLKLDPVPVSASLAAVKPAVDYIEKNCTEDFDVGFLASLCGFSSSRFYTLFKKATGLTPVEYKNASLSARATNMLLSTDKSIEEISDALNFSSPTYFRRVIKNTTGRLPKEIRNSAEL